MPAEIFVGDDHVLGDVLNRVAARLHEQGLTVVRGPAAPPPLRTEYPQPEWPHYFGRAEAAVISSRTVVTPELMSWAPRLRGLVFASSSTASCDLDAATERGLVVAHGATPPNMEGMAEATVMLLSALMLDLPLKQRQLARGLPRPASHALTARQLAGATVGLVGHGRIAREVVARLRGWKVARILVATRHPERHRSAPPVEFTDLDTLLAHSDAVSLHLPLTPATRGVIGPAELDRMRPDAVLVNTARGGLVDETALAERLASGRLRGAAIDTFDTEPVPADHPLRGLDNVVLTEHIVGHTRDLFDSLVPTAVEHVHALLAGRRPRYLANPAVLDQGRRADRPPPTATNH
ncbi:dehydrogenase [Streptacidiphilus pinicola]|uniref:Dehydrogenase n=1 Tax=Streptacidiphilus pinicola TaxID=2219663 RepID=A0A2X0IAE0_9ACTN|nr:NAD(P)-dependent oxidoreductase [Streptacidiphilus pinicola]RAG81914.1 dehydrogenase [Streptacidiphilus pinicola]